MSLPFQSVPPVRSPNAKPEIVRRTADYHPSIWGNRFINCDSEHNVMIEHISDVYIDLLCILLAKMCNVLLQITRARRQQQVEELKVVVKREVFTNKATDCSHQLKLIDAIQCLGVAYHFETEIEEALEQMHAKFQDYDDDLYNIALGFRLLRQHGHNVSCGK